MRFSCVVFLASVVVSGFAQTSVFYPKDHIAQFIVDKLDVTSFPSSIGPRRKAGKTSFKDYGLSPVKVDEEEVVLEEPDGSWRFTVRVLQRSDAGILVCVADKALNGGSYNTQGPLLLVRSDDGSMLKADKKKSTESKDCPVHRH